MEVYKIVPLEPIEIQFFLNTSKINIVTTSTTISKIEVAFKECNETNATCNGGYTINSNTI
jgi:hypothetical protein